jgi:hypothetical protein
MESTFERIQKVSKERQKLWYKSGRNGLNASETKVVQTLTTNLANLWDTYRREFASPDSLINRY